jgi:hypothetical protein
MSPTAPSVSSPLSAAVACAALAAVLLTGCGSKTLPTSAAEASPATPGAGASPASVSTSVAAAASSVAPPAEALNGEETKSAEQIIADAEAATRAAPSMRIRETFSDGLCVETSYTAAGTEETFPEVMWPAGLLFVGGEEYNVLNDPSSGPRWSHIGKADPRDIPSMAHDLDFAFSPDPFAGAIVKPVKTTYHGQPAIMLAGKMLTYYVANVGKPYLLGATITVEPTEKPAETTVLELRDFGDVPPVKAPSSAPG